MNLDEHPLTYAVRLPVLDEYAALATRLVTHRAVDEADRLDILGMLGLPGGAVKTADGTPRVARVRVPRGVGAVRRRTRAELDSRAAPTIREGCGTVAGYKWHSNHNERACDPCLAAERARSAAHKAAKAVAA